MPGRAFGTAPGRLFGFKAVEVERRGARIKKKLANDPVEAETVRLVFRLFLEGASGSGPKGVKAIAVWLNEHGYRTRGGATWGLGPIHAMLSHPVYAGRMRFNRSEARSRRRKSEAEHVFAEVPAIIELHVFERVQNLLKVRNPRVTPPRMVSGPILLTGLAVCATCDGAMTLRTGTSKTGKIHRYYTCSSCARQGKTACKGRSIRTDKLDTLVTHHLADRLLDPERLTAMLASLASRHAVKAAAVDERIGHLEKEAHEADDRLRRLYKLVEGGGDVPFRKAYLGAIVDRIEVDDREIRRIGRKDVLEQTVLANGGPVPGHRSFVRKWRTRQDSNL